MTRIGVSGVGSIGLRHARLLVARPGVTVHAFDAVPGGPARGPALPGVVWHDSFDGLLDADLAGLVVATPDAHHADQTIAALRRGVPVLVEKPVADSVAAARSVAAAADETGVPVLVGYVLRHYAVLQLVRELLADGDIGTPLSFHLTLGAYETLEVARNRFATPARYRLPYDYSHEWDYLQWLLGPVTRVAATARRAGDLPLAEDPNLLDGVLVLDSGVTGTFHLDYVQTGGVRRLELVGDRGVLSADIPDGSVWVRDRQPRPEVRRYRRAEERDAAFTRQLDHFMDVLHGRVEPCVGVPEGIRALLVADAVVAACESGTWHGITG